MESRATHTHPKNTQVPPPGSAGNENFNAVEETLLGFVLASKYVLRCKEEAVL